MRYWIDFFFSPPLSLDYGKLTHLGKGGGTQGFKFYSLQGLALQ